MQTCRKDTSCNVLRTDSRAIKVFGYKKLRKFITLDEVHILIDSLHNHAEIVSNLPDIHLSPDPDDDMIIATAIAGKADYIISGDKRDMLSLKEVQGIPIITARQAVEKLLDWMYQNV